VATDAAPVMLYPDLFTNIFEPEVLKAAVAVLNHYGRRVLLPRKAPPEVLPLMHFGFLGLAGRHLHTAIGLLLPFARQEIPILFVEPSVAAVFIEDLPKIRPDDTETRQVIGQCRTFTDFLLDIEADLPSRDGHAIVHTHCNQKAVLNGDAVNRLVAGIGLEVQVPEQGCCGMAGSFGYVKAHNPVSLRIAERNLLPAVRQADAGTLIVADGFSCRSQIRDGSDRQPMHSAVLLERLLRERQGQ
jgi:Fe-S oxidoreductase